MRREILIVLLFSALVNAALDQSYVHTVSRDGSSTIAKSTDLSVFSNLMDEGASGKIAEFCQTDGGIDCWVDDKTVTISERFSRGPYYTFTADYGIPYITYSLEVKRVPRDRFATSLDNLLFAAGVAESPGEGLVSPIDLGDEEANMESVHFMRRFGANVTYTVNMPARIHEAGAGEVDGMVSGSTVQFDLIEVMEESEPITVTSRELNFGYLTLIALVIVMAGLALSFFRAKKAKKKRKK